MRRLLDKLMGVGTARVMPESLTDEGKMPEFQGISDWINSEPLTRKSLEGKVVLVDFWTMSCVNCIRTLPHLQAWHEKYRHAGLVIIGLHTPEFGFERARSSVETAVRRFGIGYPVAVDNDYAMWKAYRNHYWPAHYFIDRRGRVRYHHFGEGDYAHSESVLRALLSEDGTVLPETAPTIESETDLSRVRTPETYLGYERLEYLGSPEPVKTDAMAHYSIPREPAINILYLDGDWEITREWASPRSAGASLLFKVDAARVNLVMDADGPRRVLIGLDGSPLREDEFGADAKADRDGAAVIVEAGGMYEIVDARGKYGERELRLTFPEPGVRLYAFTFG